MARVASVIARSSSDGSRLRETGSQSTSTGRAPHASIARTVEWKVLAEVMTSSPGPTSKALRISSSAEEPGVDTDGVVLAAVARELLLEALDVLAQDEVAPVDDLEHRHHDLVTDLGVGSHQIDEGHTTGVVRRCVRGAPAGR